MWIAARPLEARDVPLKGGALSSTPETHVVVKGSGEETGGVDIYQS
jgi:hypothetical protein